MSYPPSSPSGGPLNPWAPRGPGDGATTTTSWAPSTTTTARPGGATWGAPTGATGPAAPRPGQGGWVAPGAPPSGAQPWAPSAWQGPSNGYPAGPPASGGGGLPPHPPGYDRSPAPAAGSSGGTAPPPPAPDRGGRVMAALVGGVVGAIVAALVASGLVLATDDDDTTTTATSGSTTTEAGGEGMGVGESLDIQSLLDRVQPTVVSIYTSVEAAGATGAGSGFVYDATEGLILTNAHVIEGADEISVTFFDGSAQGAELVGAFPEDDVAMIRVPNVEGLVAADLGSSDALDVGDDVVAIGNALGLGGEPTVTTGIVSAKNRTIPGEGFTLTGLIQTDAAINPGNSGGPLLNSQGQVVGINTAKIVDASNIGFALAIDTIMPLIEELEAGGGVTEDSAFLGVSTVPLATAELPPEVLDQFGITDLAGLIVSEVTVGSGADAAGIELGDVIIAADNTMVNDNRELSDIIRAKQPGDQLTLTIERQGQPQDIVVTLGRRGG